MDEQLDSAESAKQQAWRRAETVYACGLFVAAALALPLAIAHAGGPFHAHDFAVGAFFFVYGLVTISIGYRHPNFGYYSFDRVSQVASVLVLGPVDAALINGLASLVYPWHRLWKGAPLRSVVSASLNNAGLMALIVLASGRLYTALGGSVPLTTLGGASLGAVVALVLAMQVLNDLGMLGLMLVGRRSLNGFFNGFSYALEIGSGATAVLVAVVYNTMENTVFWLLLAVLTMGMLALRQFANMRNRLEGIVEERTRSLREKTRELEQQATQDNLTGLFNRRYADRFLRQQLEQARRYLQPFAIALADIDLFKQINDRHSHATGDDVLRRVAAILRERCRKTDMIARYGGEEFLICFPQTDLSRAAILCEQLRDGVAGANWAGLGLSGVTISFGIAARRFDSSPDSLLRAADTRLYDAKNGGRNRVVA